MSAPRSLPAGEIAGVSTLMLLVFVATLYAVGVGAIIHFLVTWWFRRK